MNKKALRIITSISKIAPHCQVFNITQYWEGFLIRVTLSGIDAAPRCIKKQHLPSGAHVTCKNMDAYKDYVLVRCILVKGKSKYCEYVIDYAHKCELLAFRELSTSVGCDRNRFLGFRNRILFIGVFFSRSTGRLRTGQRTSIIPGMWAGTVDKMQEGLHGGHVHFAPEWAYMLLHNICMDYKCFIVSQNINKNHLICVHTQFHVHIFVHLYIACVCTIYINSITTLYFLYIFPPNTREI